MPRKKRSRSRNAQASTARIDQIQREIEELKSAIEKKKAEVKILEAQKAAEDDDALLDAFHRSGLMLTEALRLLTGETED